MLVFNQIVLAFVLWEVVLSRHLIDFFSWLSINTCLLPAFKHPTSLISKLIEKQYMPGGRGAGGWRGKCLGLGLRSRVGDVPSMTVTSCR